MLQDKSHKLSSRKKFPKKDDEIKEINEKLKLLD